MGHHTEIILVDASAVTNPRDTNSIFRAAMDAWEMGDNWGSETPYFDNGDVAPTLTVNGADKWISKNDRYKGGIVPLVADEDATTTTKKVKVTLDGQHIEKLRAQPTGIDYQLFEKLSDEHGPYLVDAVVTKFPRQRKAVSKPTEGKLVTKYEIISIGGFGNHSIKKGFATKVAARDEAIRLVNSDTTAEVGYTQLAVQAYVIREGAKDANIMVISRPNPEQVEVEFTLTFATPKPNAKLIGWKVLGDVHS